VAQRNKQSLCNVSVHRYLNMAPDNNLQDDPVTVALPLTREQARTILLSNTSPRMLVMCRGYNDEDDMFTELVRGDDDELDFEDEVSYPEFQLWLTLPL